jgi:hypothetical protein
MKQYNRSISAIRVLSVATSSGHRETGFAGAGYNSITVPSLSNTRHLPRILHHDLER